jgi:hypothetical protein
MYHKKKKGLGMKGMRMKEMLNGGKMKGLKKKGPSTDKIKNNKANLEARKLMDSSLPSSANVGKNPSKEKELKASGYTPQPKPAPKPMNKIKGYRRVWDAKAGKYVNKVIASSTNSDANRARKYENKKAGKGMKMPGGGKMPMYMAGGKIYKDGGSLMQALLKDPKQRARAKRIMGL